MHNRISGADNTEIFLIQISFFEARMNKAAFELIRKDTMQ
jgi:CRISPR/Cas system-associated endoribonuclease Cas2